VVEPTLTEETEVNADTKLNENKKKLVVLLKTLKDDPYFKQLIKNDKNVYEVKDNKGTKQKVDKFKTGLDMSNDALAELQKDTTLKPPEEEEEEEEEEIPNFENIVEKIKNVFTLILLTSSDDLSIDTIFTESDFTPDNIKRIKECNDSDILYYCYLVITADKKHKIGDKIIINKEERERVRKLNEKMEKTRQTQLKKVEDKRQKELAAQEMKLKKTLAKETEQQQKILAKEEKTRLTQMKRDEDKRQRELETQRKKTIKNGEKKGGGDDEDYEAEESDADASDAEEEEAAEEGVVVAAQLEGTIIAIGKKEIIDAKGNIKYKKIYKIKWDDPTKGVEEYDEKQFKDKLENISFSNTFDLDSIADEDIRKIVNKNMELIQFLIGKQTDMNEINNLFDNIKEEMGKLKAQLNDEKNAFINNPNQSDFCPTLYSKENSKVLDIIRKYLTPKREEKKLFGEVFTPLEIVCEMLEKLSRDVWKNYNLKWLDPANGIGNYPIVVYFKLMETLKNVEGFSNENKRSKHIIEKMLYMNELNPVNVAITKKYSK
jgi:hypothetical protein